MTKKVGFIGIMILLVMSSCNNDTLYHEEIMTWRKERIENLTARIGWASLAGLYWLKEGDTWIGKTGNKEFQLNGELMDTIGSISLDREGVSFAIYGSSQVYNGDSLVKRMKLKTDKEIEPTLLSCDQYYWTIIDRNSTIGLRLWDTTHIGRTKYSELEYFDIDPKFRVKADFTPYDIPKQKALKNILGMDIIQSVPGYLSFNIDGKEYTLEPIEGGPGEFFLIFADETTGGETYGGGRYLYCDKPGYDNKTIIDFNKSHTPPCGFTVHATCLLPRRENTLGVEILAGEKYHDDH